MSERLFNTLFFALRGRLRWSRPSYRPRPEDLGSYFAARPWLLPVARRMEQEYALGGFRDRATSGEYRESLYVLELMERFLPVSSLPDPVRALDVGCKNFAYARGLYHFLRHAGTGTPRSVTLVGIELDPYQIYRDLHSRLDYARYHIRGLEGCEYHGGDVNDHAGRYDVITWFLPFLTEYAHRKWGLPGSRFRPEPTLRHVLGLLAEGGILLLANREEEERDLQADLLRRLGVRFEESRRHESDWMNYAPRYVFVVKK